MYSCKKTEVPASETLMSHTWTATIARIVTYDTIRIIKNNGVGQNQPVPGIFRMDTTYNLAACLQQSTYSFLQNGTLHITNMCAIGQPAIDTLWSLGTNSFFEIYLIDDPVADAYYSRFFVTPGLYGSSQNVISIAGGTYLTKANSSEFVVDQKITGMQAVQRSVNGVLVDSLMNFTTDKYTTFTVGK
jgi:hypothetical protein